MTEVTNRTVAALLFVAMAVTVFSTAITLNKLNDVSEFGLTGFATTPNATARLNVSALTSIRYVIDSVDWEEGQVNTSFGDHCNLTTSDWPSPGYVGCSGFADPIPDGLILQNDGNQRAAVQVRILQSAQDWIGGTDPIMLIYVQDNLVGSCDSGTDIFETETELTTVNQVACADLDFADGTDRIQYGFKVRVPTDAPPGDKTVTVQSTASPAP